MSVVVVLPSRGRPERAREAIEAVRATAALISTEVVLAVDEDDPELAAYRALAWPGLGPAVTTVTLAAGETGDLVRATNTVSLRVAEADPDAIIGNLGDDHVCRSSGWDRLVTDALATPGIAYGDDRLQGAHLPTAPFISASIVLALGWYALPRCRHLYVDDAWRELAAAVGVLRYLPDVVIEHMHPHARKAEWDEGYERANAIRTLEHDRAAYERWRRGRGFRRDVAKVRRVAS